ncbi:MAG: AI-2E family transporter [Xanthobacteraceae bacterium]|nr:AI-2E family transporter [Xanthobacteraceae bacterium]MBV9632445.1 AI-2E family transporter [Xanthobacteraceae bacterium]
MDIFSRMTAPDLAEQTKSTAPSAEAGLQPRPAEASGQVAPAKRRQTWIGLQRAAQLSAIGIFVILLGAFLQAARVVVMPVASAIVIGLMLSPLARWASRYRIPPTISAILAVVFFLVLIQFALIAVAAPLITILNHAPDIADNIRQKLEAFDPILNGVRNLQAQIAPSSGDLGSLSLPKPDLASWASSVVGLLTPAAGEIVIFLATLFLYLISREQLRRNLILMASDSLARLRAIRVFNEVEEKLVRYIGTVAVINLVMGLLTALGTYLLGYPNPALLGALEFVCAFVPYLGAAFMLMVLAFVGLITFSGWHQTLLAVGLFLAMVTCEGQVITPNIVGHRFTTSPLTIFLALAFWTWLWGPVGTFLSVPFVLIGVAVVNHFFPDDAAVLPK